MKNFLGNLALLLVLVVAIVGWSLLPWWGAASLALVLLLWLGLSRVGRQAASATAVALGSLGGRLGAASVVVVGIAGVVAVLVALLAMGEGFRATLQSSGRDDTAIVLRGGSVSEAQSVMLRDDIEAIGQAPGIARDAQGRPLLSPELAVAASLRTRGGGEANVQLRGVEPAAFALRPELKIVQGRAFRPGMRELIVGEGAQRQFAGLQPGQSVTLGNQRWQVVGVFTAQGAYSSELWGDRQAVADAWRRGHSAQSVLVKLDGPGALAAFTAALASDPKLKVEASSSRAFFARQSQGLSRTVRVVGGVVGAIMAIGAVFGALNCMFAAVAARAREIATLRAIGFRGLPVVVSVLLETLLLALLGGLLGGGLVWLVFNGYSAATLNGFNQLVFQFKVSPALLWQGLQWALAIGLIGGLFPAVRAARLPLATALREQ